MRIGILGFAHESNTFVSVPTTLQRFSERGIHRGKGIIDRWKGSHHELGGFIAGSEAHGFAAVPLMTANATPGGPLTDTAYETILGEMIGLLEKDEELDGLLLALHGAMVAEGYSDADGEIVSRIREVFGDKPIVMTLDCHANVSSKMVDNVTATILYRTNPHVDQRERGLEAAGLIASTVWGRIHPVQALDKPPMVVNISKQQTSQQPAKGLIQDAERVMRQPGVLSASVGLGFAFADTEKMGASFIVVADGDVKRARRQARWMARRAWDRRSEFLGDLPSPTEAVRKAAVSPVHPVVLMDVGDNVGGGSPADSTILLSELFHQRMNDGLIVLRDPEAVERCVRAGVGTELTIDVGGKSDDKHGQPVCIRGRVRTLSDGKFIDERPRHGGQRFYDQGTTAVVETPERHTVVLTSLRMPPFSLEQILSLGIAPENKRVIVVKGVIAPRAAYEPIAKEIITVDTPGSTSANLMHFEYRHRRRPLYPFEAHASYPPMSE